MYERRYFIDGKLSKLQKYSYQNRQIRIKNCFPQKLSMTNSQNTEPSKLAKTIHKVIFFPTLKQKRRNIASVCPSVFFICI